MPGTSLIEYSERGNLIVNQEYEEFMGIFPSFDSVMTHAEGNTVKKIKGRDVLRIEISDGDRRRYFFLKRHASSFTGIRGLLAFFFPGQFPSEGRKEFFHICEFRKEHLATVEAVAAGERCRYFFWEESFVITEDFHPFETLENLLAQNSGFREKMENPQDRNMLLSEIMKYARKMHDAGLNHCDFNADHILIRYNGESRRPEVALYDLQRIRRKKHFRFRWVIKSISELSFSLPDEFFTEADRKELLLHYKGKKKPGLPERIQLRWIEKKTERIRKHTEKIMDRHRKMGNMLRVPEDKNL